MDDKRTLLGLLLIGLIFLLSPYYYEWMGLSPKPEGPSEQDSAETQQQAAEKVPVESNPPQRLEQPLQVLTEEEKPAGNELGQASGAALSSRREDIPTFTPRTVAVQTPLLDLALSTQGGTIQSAFLQQYTLPDDGRPVQLIAPQRSGLTVRLQQIDAVEDLSLIQFEPSR